MVEYKEHKKIYVCVAGCRYYDNYGVISDYLNYVLKNLKKQGEIVIVHGGCRGVDLLAEKWAKEENNYETIIFIPDWSRGKKAGPDRNKKMVEFVAAQEKGFVVAFWDGTSRGTKNLIFEAKKLGLSLRVKYIS